MTQQRVERLPAYKDLPVKPGAPTGSAWGLWGDDDQIGAFNLLTPERVLAAARLVRKGAVFPLNWELELPEPAFGARGKPRHFIFARFPWGRDDVLDNFYLQGSSQWDALSHIGSPEQGYYNGVQPEQITGQPGTRNGIEHWARRGIVGRGVLLDVGRWFESQGRSFDYSTTTPITADDIEATRQAQGVELMTGDILLVRTGWMAYYLQQPETWRLSIARNPTVPGLEPSRAMIEYMWDHHVTAVCADNYAVEVFPFMVPLGESLHGQLLALLGIALGEFWYMESLAADCAQDGVYEFMLTSAPLNKLGGVGSPPNALAIK